MTDLLGRINAVKRTGMEEIIAASYDRPFKAKERLINVYRRDQLKSTASHLLACECSFHMNQLPAKNRERTERLLSSVLCEAQSQDLAREIPMEKRDRNTKAQPRKAALLYHIKLLNKWLERVCPVVEVRAVDLLAMARRSRRQHSRGNDGYTP